MNLFGLIEKKGKSGLTYSELETWLNDVMQMTIPMMSWLSVSTCMRMSIKVGLSN